ncbi:MAG TPA: hypothetical protein VE549_02880 [Myxococcaceae bacterium]|nr:hypothetical protein [Myxococcaceae bacterium]
MRNEHTWLGCVIALAAATGAAQSTSTSGTRFGAVVAPAALSAASTAAYVFAGAPEIGAGFRQGLSGLELDVRVGFDYFAVAGALELSGRIPLAAAAPYQVAPALGVGMVFNSGAQWLDRDNFAYNGVRVSPALRIGRQLGETAAVLGELTLPVDVPVSQEGGYRFRPLLGAGGEVYLGQQISAGLMAQVGADVLKAPLVALRTRFAFAVRLGIGYRFF